MQVNRDRVSNRTDVDDRLGKYNASRKNNASSLVAELDVDDLFEPSDSINSMNDKKISHFNDVCAQMLEDYQERPKTKIVLQIVARIFGATFARCLSNFIKYVSGSAWLDPRRDYAVLPKDASIYKTNGEILTYNGNPMTAEKIAQLYKPRLLTISEDQSIDESMRPVEMRYEVLPPRSGKNDYSIIYYVRREREHMPVIFLGVLLDFLRPWFWATKSEWSAVEIDIDRETGKADKINCESANYTGDPLSYEITSTNDLHLPVKAALKNGKWSHTLYQKNNRAKNHEIADPFEKDTHADFVFINWNGGFDLAGATKYTGYKMDGNEKGNKLYRLADVPLEFLDIKTYRKEALDLRNTWLNRRKTGHCVLNLAPRKDPSEFKVVNLISNELPSLLTVRTSST